MNPFDETPPRAASNLPPSEEGPAGETVRSPSTAVSPDAEGVAVRPAAEPAAVPADLEITWSWRHFIVFVVFAFISFLFVDIVILAANAPHEHLSAQQLEQYYMAKPFVPFGIMGGWYAAIFLFLYVTLSVLGGHTFWPSLGWRRIVRRAGELFIHPGFYFVAGCGLSIFVALATVQIKEPENLPIQEILKHREAALMYMAMAVVVAPLVEETLFRGYMYPSIARFICFVAKSLGFDHGLAVRYGVGGSIVLTGMLFGAMHGAQLGWTLSLVTVLTFVGIMLTLVRARTGSVFASYLMHLGYNSLIAFIAIVSTHGFTRLPIEH